MSRFAKVSLSNIRRNSKRRLSQAIESLETRRMFATIQVNSLTDVTAPDANITLREALAQAKAQAGDDTITFDPTLFSGGPQTITLISGALQVDSNVTITGPGEATLTVDANNLSRVYDVASVTAAMSGMTVSGGNASFGAGISSVGGLALTDMTIENNTVPNSNVGVGGGIYTRGNMSLTNVDVITNTVVNPVFGGGAGIYNDGHTLNILNGSDISGNNSDGEGGGIWNANGGTVNVTSSTVNDNSADLRGGGIFNESGTVNVLTSTLDNNSANAGGGINNLSTLNITASTLSDNSALSDGGALHNSSGSAKIVNSTISGNNADTGGGIGVSGGTVTVTNSTISDNDATAGAGGGVSRTGGTVTLKNTIVAANTATTTGKDISGSFASSTFNLIGTGDGGTGINNNANGNKVGTDAAPIDAQLGALGNNGGTTETMDIPTTSPAFNTGSNANLPAGTTTDQRGSLRIVNGTVDIGAVENQTVLPSSQTPFPGPGNFVIAAAGTSTLQAENFDNGGEGISWSDSTPGNATGLYRNNVDVDIKQVSNDTGSFYIANTIGGEYTEYTVDVAQTGTYTIGFRVASKGAGGNFHLQLDDATNLTGSITPPNTGDWNNWTTVSKSGISLTAGTHVLRLSFDQTGANGAVSNVNYLTFTQNVAPVTTTLTSDTAAYVRDGGSATANFGNATTIDVKKSTSGFNRESWIKFNIASLTTISNAKLRIFGNLLNAGSIQLGVLTGNNGWTEAGITFNNKPPVGAQITTKTISGTTPTTYDIDITSFLQAQKAANATEVTLVLRSNTTTDTLTSFNSDEHATVSTRPQLIVQS